MLETPRYQRPASIILGIVIAIGSGYFALNRKRSARLQALDPHIDEKAVMTAVRLHGWYEQTQDLLARANQSPSALDQSGWEQMLKRGGAVAIDTGSKTAERDIVDTWGNRVIWRPAGDTPGTSGWSLMSVGQNAKNDGGTGDDIVMDAAMFAQSKREGVLRALKSSAYSRVNR